MCGIVGTIPGLNETDQRRVLRSLNHRGPDANGSWQESDGQIFLGHTRLSILDLSDLANQPMHYDQLTIVFNGEVYNYLEIRNELNEEGYKFNTDSDTEVVLKAWHFWGEKCLNKFNGMWAFALYDREAKQLTLTRDRYGIKPLYYYHNKEKFFFASEIQTIHSVLGKNTPLRSDALQSIAKSSFGWHGSNHTYLENVYALPGGHLMIFKESKTQSTQWYQMKKITVPIDFKTQATRLKELIEDSCRLRMRSDVALGTCLSGGVDSGSLSSIIHQSEGINGYYKNFTHKAFCASFPNSTIDESSQASFLANELNLKLDIVRIPEPSISDLEKAMSQCDGPMNSLGFYPIWKLYEHIRSMGVKVTLDGQGPDEMLGGYKPLYYALKGAMQNKNLNWFVDLYQTYGSLGENKQVSSRNDARNTLKGLIINEFKNPIKKLTGIGTPYSLDLQSGPDHLTNIFDRNLHHQFSNHPLPGILQQFDRCSMAHGVECRMPFMDYRIVEYLFSLPPESKVSNGYTKWVLREAVKGVLPERIRLNKNKIGFNAPLIDWYSGKMRNWILDIMNSNEYLESPYFDGKVLLERFDKFIKNADRSWGDAWPFWGSIHLTWWLKNLN